MNWFVYIVQCSDGTLYTGITTNIEKRIDQHNGVKAGGAKYTAHKRPVQLRYLETGATRSEVAIRESQIKKLSRDQKQELCKD